MKRCSLLLPSILVLVTGCNSIGPKAGAPIPTAEEAPASRAATPKPATAPKAKKPKKPTLKELETQLVSLKEAKVEARREARYAQAELEIAEAGARISRAEAEEATRKARMGLEKARKAMEAFDQVERPLAVRKGALRIADAENRVRSAETDLAGLEDIFAEEVAHTGYNSGVRQNVPNSRMFEMCTTNRIAVATLSQRLLQQCVEVAANLLDFLAIKKIDWTDVTVGVPGGNLFA